MTMFKELYALATTATLTMIVSADEQTGRLTISVLPKPRKDVGEPALTKDLTLTAIPEDFDAGFVEALRGYREKRESLTEQVEATKEVLEAAKSLSAKKATKASKPTQSANAAPAPVTKRVIDDEDDDIGQSGDQSDEGAATPPAPGESLELFG